MDTNVLHGQSFPLGATVYKNGVNFSIFSKSSMGMELLLFDQATAPQPSRVISLDPNHNRTFFYWHVFVPGVSAGQVYAYRAHGAFAPEQGHRFDGAKVLLDPYAKVIANWEHYSREAASRPGDNCAQALRGVVVDTTIYDWEDDESPSTPYAKTVIYELHIDAFTRHPNSGVSSEKRGTYAGLIEKIPYLKELGITAVELMPIHQFDPQDAPLGLTNYWGYSTVAFFAPHAAYSSHHDSLGVIDEFRDMVKALHREGIEVILDVVFNHTAEGNHLGPTLSFRGLENSVYYILEDDRIHYRDYSGCGNTVKANHPVVGKLILDCLHYWVAEMHVDGFRFDLASVLSRNRVGEPDENSPMLWTIDSDPALASTKIIAEAWDAAGLYQVGSFSGDRFAEWNGPYRDDVRRFVRGDNDTVGKLAARIMASPDIYPSPDREPNRSINFVTCHDGFTLNDLVSYNIKHNEANKETNRDGMNDNYSWNCGTEGETDDPAIETLRLRQIKNLLTILFTSQGTPMMLMGDEIQRSQLGNNNAYCQNNELSWFDWSFVEKHTDLLRFVRKLIDLTQSLYIFQQERILQVTFASHLPHIVWHGVRLGEPGWERDSHSLAFTLRHPEKAEYLHIMLNAYWQPLAFELPLLGTGDCWHCIIDTARPSPDDFCDFDTAPCVLGEDCLVEARSAVVLMTMPN
ncbi:MAG: glycogen debranching protein GlgX [Cyanobacteria bacterium RU_5_0]|nr:glycogen debranching protein GlgX [Cyanobacteria bacterium RU_5_0]